MCLHGKPTQRQSLLLETIGAYFWYLARTALTNAFHITWTAASGQAFVSPQRQVNNYADADDNALDFLILRLLFPLQKNIEDSSKRESSFIRDLVTVVCESSLKGMKHNMLYCKVNCLFQGH